MTLQRYIKKKKAYHAYLTDEAPSIGYASSTIITREEENILCEYLLIYAASDNKKDKKSGLYVSAKI